MKARKNRLSIYVVALVSMALGSASAFAQTTFTFTQLDVPGSVSTEADGINAPGQIIGFFVDSAGKQHGFLHQGATFTQLDFPGATATRTAGINNSGVIAGSFTDAAGVQHGLVGRPGGVHAV